MAVHMVYSFCRSDLVATSALGGGRSYMNERIEREREANMQKKRHHKPSSHINKQINTNGTKISISKSSPFSVNGKFAIFQFKYILSRHPRDLN